MPLPESDQEKVKTEPEETIAERVNSWKKNRNVIKKFQTNY